MMRLPFYLFLSHSSFASAHYDPCCVLLGDAIGGHGFVWTKCVSLCLQMHLALYCFANGQLSTALKLLYRARYLMLMVCGEDHPEMALLDVSTV